MAKGRPRRRTAAKIATKREQQGLFDAAERLAADPSPLVPQVMGRVKTGPVRRLERRLKRIQGKADRARWLRWYTSRGPALARAYATLLMVREQGAASRMASMKTPVGELKYAYRGGNVSRRALLAVQHHHHPEVRVLGYRELATESGAVAWALPDKVALTAHDESPPAPWLRLVLKDPPLALHLADADGHPVDPTTATEDAAGPREPRLQTPAYDGVPIAALEDPASNVPFGLHLKAPTGPLHLIIDAATAARRPDAKVLHHLATYFIGIDAHRDLLIGPAGIPWHIATDDPAAAERARDLLTRHKPTLRKKRAEAYLAGLVPEHEIIRHIQERWTEALAALDDRLLVIGDECHGDDEASFLAALDVTDHQRDAIRVFLEVHDGPVIAQDRSLGKVLDVLWKDAPAALPRLHPDPKELDDILRRHAQSPPAVILEDVLVASRAKQRLKGYPYWTRLPDTVAALDRTIRARHTGGRAAALDAIDQSMKGKPHKGVLYAALMVLDGIQGRDWRFDKNDKEAGEFLRPKVEEALEADADTYAHVLGEIHTLAGGTGGLPAPDGTV